MRQFAFLVSLLLLSFSASAAETSAYQKWQASQREMNEFAGGPTGMYAAQDKRELLTGETIHLAPAPVLERVRWAKGTAPDALVTVEYKSGQLLVRGPGITATDLLQSKEGQIKLPNGLIVLSTPFKENARKVWVYNPKLPALRGFKSIPYFPYNASGEIQGAFHKNEQPKPVNYLDSRGQQGVMYLVGTLDLPWAGKTYTLKTYSYKKSWDQMGAILLLLKDRTSGKTTYEGGRVIDIEIPKGTSPKTLSVNLNMAYNFLCAHSDFYNCPLMLINSVDTELNFGEKYPPEGAVRAGR